MKSYLKPGTWNAVCMVCGFTHKSTDLKLRWDGLWVCPDDFEFRNPQDFIRIPNEAPTPEWTSPETDVFLTDDLLTEASENLLTESGDNLIW